MENRASVTERGAQLEHGPDTDRMNPVIHLVTGGMHGVGELSRRASAHVLSRNDVGGNLGQNPLGAVARDHRAQHVVPLDQAIPGTLQPVDVERIELELAIGVTGNAAVSVRCAATEQVGGLNLGQRERVVALGRLGDDVGEPVAPYVVEDHVLLIAQQLQALAAHDAARRSEAQLTGLLPQCDSEHF